MSILAVILVVAVLVILVMLLAMLSQRGNEQDGRSVRFVGGAAIVVAVAFTVWGLIEAVTMFTPGTQLTFTVPIESQPITLRDGVELQGVTSPLDSGSYTQADVTSSAFSPATRITAGIGILFIVAAPVMIAVMVQIVCRRLLTGTPFSDAVVRLSMVTAMIVLVTGFIGAALTDIASSHAGSDVFEFAAAWSVPDDSANPDQLTGYPASTFLVQFPVWPLAAAFIIAIFGTLVKFGSRVQRERDDLVIETEELRRDTEGLV